LQHSAFSFGKIARWKQAGIEESLIMEPIFTNHSPNNTLTKRQHSFGHCQHTIIRCAIVDKMPILAAMQTINKECIADRENQGFYIQASS